MSNANHPLQPVCQTWLRCIEAAKAAKARRFDRDAAECMRFYTGPYDFLWDQFETDKHVRVQGGEADSGQWRTRVSTNKVAEFVQIFGPSLYARNPTRRVTPRRPPDLPPDLYAMMGPEAQFLFQQSMAQTTKQVAIDAGRAALLECYLNQTPNALDLRFNMRQAIDEALIKGMGVLWPEKYKVPGAEFHMVGSFYGSIDELQIDPDAKCLNDAKWVARRCVQPTWEVEAKFGLPPGSLCERGHMESSSQAAALTEAEQSLGLQGRGGDGSSNDLMVYWKIWSKMGCGGRLAKVAPGLRQALEIFPVHSYL